jgi:hypothetical protein
MKLRSISLAFAVLALSFFTCAHAAEEDRQPMCPNDGYIPDRLVPNAHVAEAIYRAVAEVIVPWNFKKYPTVTVNDGDDHWEVSQTNNDPPPKPVPNTVIVTTGGGQLYMDINKCTGAISHAALAR